MVRGHRMIEHMARESPTRVLPVQHSAGIAKKGRELFVHVVHDPRNPLSIAGIADTCGRTAKDRFCGYVISGLAWRSGRGRSAGSASKLACSVHSLIDATGFGCADQAVDAVQQEPGVSDLQSVHDPINSGLRQ